MESLSPAGLHVQGCTSLRELRLNHNALTALPQGLSVCRQLRIVDLGGNPISALPPIKASLNSPQLYFCADIVMVGFCFAYSACLLCTQSLKLWAVSFLAEVVFAVSFCASGLKGRNLAKIVCPAQILAQLPNLQNLTLKGCSVTEQESYPKCVIDLLPQLHILDNQKVSSGTHSKQPATVKHGTMIASVPGKNGKQISAKADVAQAEEEHTGSQAPTQLKAKSSKLIVKSSDAPLNIQESRQATKRKHAESASEAPPRAEDSEQHDKKRKARSTTAPAAEAGAFARARLASKATVKATKPNSKQSEISIPVSTITPKAPGAKLKILEDKAGPAADMKRHKHSSGAQPPDTPATATDEAGRAKGKTSKLQKPAIAASEPPRKVAISADGLSNADIKNKTQQKAAKGAASIVRHEAGGGSHALAIGKEVNGFPE